MPANPIDEPDLDADGVKDGEVAELLSRIRGGIDAERQKVGYQNFDVADAMAPVERYLKDFLREAAGVREELQRVYELVHFHGKASREAQQRAESAEKRLTDAMSALRTLADCDVDEDRSTVPELLEMAQRDRAFVQKRLAETEALLDEVAATDCYGMPIGVAERIGDWKSKRSANQPPVETKRYVSGDQVYREHIPGYEGETKACPECGSFARATHVCAKCGKSIPTGGAEGGKP